MALNINFFTVPQSANSAKNSTKNDNSFESAKSDSNFSNHLNKASNNVRNSSKNTSKPKNFDSSKKAEVQNDKSSHIDEKSKADEIKKLNENVSETDNKVESTDELKENDKKNLSDNELELLKELLAILQTNTVPMNEGETCTKNTDESNTRLMELLSEIDNKAGELSVFADKNIIEAVNSIKQLLTVSSVANEMNGNSNNLLAGLDNNLKSELVQTLQGIIENSNNADQQNTSTKTIDEAVFANEITIQKEVKPLFDNQRYKVKLDAPIEVEEAVTEVSENQQSSNETDLSNSSDESTVDNGKILDSNKVISTNKEDTDNLTVKFSSIQNEANAKDINEVIKVDKTADVPKTEVIKQIVQKAEVLLKDGKSEMSIQLEPENLGKLALKIAIEKGVVTAKFVAENQGVKQTIESNFNQLKDMLQEKGITVQSFSVSVGHEGREFNSRNNLNVWKENINTNRKKSLGGSYLNMDDYQPVSSKINPYDFHEGKIDFKA